MLADNLGYGVPSSYNGGILDTPTPRIAQLAAEGLRLTNVIVENQCTPRRAALMTGRLPIRSGIGKAIAAGAPGGLHPWEITMHERAMMLEREREGIAKAKSEGKYKGSARTAMAKGGEVEALLPPEQVHPRLPGG